MESTFLQLGLSKLVRLKLSSIYLLYLGCLPEYKGCTVVAHDLDFSAGYLKHTPCNPLSSRGTAKRHVTRQKGIKYLVLQGRLWNRYHPMSTIVDFPSDSQGYGRSIPFRTVISLGTIKFVIEFTFPEDAAVGCCQYNGSLARCDIGVASIWHLASSINPWNRFLRRNDRFLLYSFSTPFWSHLYRILIPISNESVVLPTLLAFFELVVLW